MSCPRLTDADASPARSGRFRWGLLAAVALVLGTVVFARLTGPRPSGDGVQDRPSTVPTNLQPTGLVPVDAVRRGDELEAELAHVDPARAGWESEVFSDATGQQLAGLFRWVREGDALSEAARYVAEPARVRPLRPADLRRVYADRAVVVRRWRPDESEVRPAAEDSRRPLAEALRSLVAAVGEPAAVRIEFKTIGVELDEEAPSTTVRWQASHDAGHGIRQTSATWRCTWSGERPPRLRDVAVLDFEEVLPGEDGAVRFADATLAALGGDRSFAAQLQPSFDDWRSRTPRNLGNDLVGNHGIALGDVNGDGLDDLYVTQTGGLPNRLYVQQADATAVEVSRQAGVDFLDFSRCALFLDLDNDGDQDLVVGLAWSLLVLENNGRGHFALRNELPCAGMVYSLCAADYDGDGDLDLYVCGRYGRGEAGSQRVLGLPVPYHDANNGGPNTLWANQGGWQFDDVTARVGLDENNRRFSLAACWEDFDNDGDQDLYVANDFGRNNLYRNDGGRFTDIAAAAGVEDLGAGMSAAWGDADLDGWMDLYVGNMYSAAGNRVTAQLQFLSGADESQRALLRRHARGNSLFRNAGDGTFEDLSEAAAVAMGRWAWGSVFIDFNNDGWEDLFVANGFITGDDTGDL